MHNAKLQYDKSKLNIKKTAHSYLLSENKGIESLPQTQIF